MVDNHSECWPSSHLKHEADVGRRDLPIPKTGRSIDEASFIALPSKAYFSQTPIRLPSPKPSLPRARKRKPRQRPDTCIRDGSSGLFLQAASPCFLDPLIKAAREGRWGLRDATLVLVAYRQGL